MVDARNYSRPSAIGGRSTRVPLVMLFLAFAGLALFLGAAAAVGYGLYEVAIVGACFVGALAWAGRRSWMAPGSVGAFWSALILTFATAFVSTFSPRPINGLMELWLLALAGLSIAAFVEWTPRSRLLQFATGAYLAFLFFAAVSTVYGDSRGMAATYQFLYNLKFPFMLLLGFRVGWRPTTERGFLTFTNWIWVLFAVVVVWQVASPSTYYALAVGSTDKLEAVYGNPFLPGVRVRATGPFPHSGHLALFAVFFASICAVRIVSLGGKAGTSTWIAFIAYLGLTLLSGQRQELAALFMILGALFIAFRVKSKTLGLVGAVAATVVGFAVVLIVLGDEQVTRLLGEWGMRTTFTPLTASRTVFFWDSIQLANSHFPLGTGLGTFAGEGARMFDHSMYDAMGYGRYWWYRTNKFLVDTYWPNFIAEAGWIGASSMFLIPLTLVGYAFVRAWRESNLFNKRLWAMAFSGNAIALVVSLTSPLYSDPNFVAVILMMFGMAYGVSNRATLNGMSESDRETKIPRVLQVKRR
jgi:hypothetical protein